MRLRVGYSTFAADQFAKLKAAREGSAQATIYRGFQHFVEHIIADSELAFLPQNRLTGDLAGLLRVHKARMRLFYIASREKQAAIVLLLGTSLRKEGDKNDPYEEIRWYLRRSDFDPYFAELGLTKPRIR
jgi:hypothetical protein